MKPIKFEGSNALFAKNQPQYQQLPAHVAADGTVTTCWKLTWFERLTVLARGRVWWQNLTFNKPLQPQRPSVGCPLPELNARFEQYRCELWDAKADATSFGKRAPACQGGPGFASSAGSNGGPA